MEADPDETAVRNAIDAEFTAFLERLQREHWRPEEIRRLKPQIRPIMNGMDAKVWRDDTGTLLPWPKRFDLFCLALCRLEADPVTQLRSHLLYVTKQQLSERKAKPETLEKREHLVPSGAALASSLPARKPFSDEEEQAFDEWCAAHPIELRQLRDTIGAEITSDPVYRDLPDAPIKQSAMRSRARRALRERVLEIISRETAGVS